LLDAHDLFFLTNTDLFVNCCIPRTLLRTAVCLRHHWFENSFTSSWDHSFSAIDESLSPVNTGLEEPGLESEANIRRRNLSKACIQTQYDVLDRGANKSTAPKMFVGNIAF
jgi:hypothetical protein